MNYVSYETVMERLFKVGIAPQFIEDVDTKELMYDALSLMGAKEIMIPCEAEIVITDFQGILPQNFRGKPNGVMHMETGTALTEQTCIYSEQFPSAGQYIDPNDLDPATPTLIQSSRLGGDPTYKIVNGAINTGFQQGTVRISYNGFPTDNRNCPLIPDDVRVIRGVVAFCAATIAKAMWVQDKLSKDKMLYFEQEALWGIPSGSNAIKMPDLDRMENIARLVNSPIIKLGMHAEGFRGITRRAHYPTHTRK